MNCKSIESKYKMGAVFEFDQALKGLGLSQIPLEFFALVDTLDTRTTC